MYEQYLRDPASVPEEWRLLFDNGKSGELPIIPTDRTEVLAAGTGSREWGVVRDAAPPSPTPHSPLPVGAIPITGPAARLVQNMTDSLSVPTAKSPSARSMRAARLSTPSWRRAARSSRSRT